MAKAIMDGYVDLVQSALSQSERAELNNDDRDHARVLTALLIGQAEERVQILCHRLASDVYGSREVTTALNEAFSRNPKLKCEVWVKEQKPDFSPFLALLLSHDAEIRTSVDTDCDDILIVDGKHGREETDADKRKAKAYFYDEDWADRARHKLEAIA